MKLLLALVCFGGFLGAEADGLVPLSAMMPNCIRQGKCVNDRGLTDPSVCCSGVCDKNNGCVSTTEASSILTRLTVSGAPFICKTDSYFGVRCDKPTYFHSGKVDSLFGTAPSDGFEITPDQSRDLGDTSVCALATPSVSFGDTCLCNSDCVEGKCTVLLANALDDLFAAIDDLSFVGKCLAPPGDYEIPCVRDCDCVPGSDCIPRPCLPGTECGSVCSMPAGSTVDCTTEECTPPAFCNSDECKLTGGTPCVADEQCASGVCDPVTSECTTVTLALFAPCGSGTPGQCDDGLVCESNLCVYGAECTQDSECGASGVCVLGRCMGTPGEMCNEDLQCQSGYCTGGVCSAILDCTGLAGTLVDCCAGAAVGVGDLCVVAGGTTCSIAGAPLTISGTLCVEAGATLTFTTPFAGGLSFASGSTIRFYGRPSSPIVVTSASAPALPFFGVTIDTTDAHIQHTRAEYAVSWSFLVSDTAAAGASLILRNLASFCSFIGLYVESDDAGFGFNRVTRFHSHRAGIGLVLEDTLGTSGTTQSPLERISASVFTYPPAGPNKGAGVHVLNSVAVALSPNWPLSYLQLLAPGLSASDMIRWSASVGMGDAAAMTWSDVSVGQLGFTTVGDLLAEDFNTAGSDLSAFTFSNFVQQAGSFPGGFDASFTGSDPTFAGTVDTAAPVTHPALQLFPWVQALGGLGPGGPHLVRLDSDLASCSAYPLPT
ncbi:MAG: hypothetical protein MHM6MM_002794 [Cercozoa sp. M6MM]